MMNLNASNYKEVASSWKFLADVRSMSNYFPYGLKIEEGSWSASNYQFAYNGKQEEVFDKDYLHYGARSYDSEEIRFIKTDDLEDKYPNQSPYVYGNSNPIRFIDYLGLSGKDVINEAKNWLGTPYEYGGKNPVFKGGIPDGTYIKVGNEEILLNNRTYVEYISQHSSYPVGRVNNNIYKTNSSIGELVGFNLSVSSGLDCSALVSYAYNNDKDHLLGNFNPFYTGTGKIKSVFLEGQEKGKAIIHKNFKQVVEGDIIYHPGHVMLATGNIQEIEEDGKKILQIEIIEAPTTGAETRKIWYTPKNSDEVLHPIRPSEQIIDNPVSDSNFKGTSEDYHNNSRSEGTGGN